MATFSEFLSTFSSDTEKKGKQFEQFAKWYFLNDPVWKTRIKKHGL